MINTINKNNININYTFFKWVKKIERIKKKKII